MQTLRNAHEVIITYEVVLCLRLILWYYWKYPPRPSALGNISNFGEIIFSSHLNVGNYLYSV